MDVLIGTEKQITTTDVSGQWLLNVNRDYKRGSDVHDFALYDKKYGGKFLSESYCKGGNSHSYTSH